MTDSLRIKVIVVVISFLAIGFTLSALSGLLIRISRRRNPNAKTRWSPEIVSWQVVILVLSLVAVAWIALRSPITAAVLFVTVIGFAVLARQVLRLRTASSSVSSFAALLVGTVGAAFLCTSTFVSWPVDLPQFIRPLFGGISNVALPNSGKTLTFTGKTISLGEISNFVYPKAEGNRDSLKLDNSTLILDPATKDTKLVFDRLDLTNGSRIITNGGSLTIQANELIPDGGSVISFTDKEATPPKAVAGRSGFDGMSGGRVLLEVGHLDGHLTADLSGQSGGAGGDGLAGVPGGPGANGENAADSFITCRHGGSDGLSGLPGGSGGPGGPGGKGGDGGILLIHGGIVSQMNQISLTSDGGKGGLGGNGGPGGPGGVGGQGGSGSTFCGGGHPGLSGPAGNSGPRGADGPPGSLGPKQPRIL
jgi:hypothetical protein